MKYHNTRRVITMSSEHRILDQLRTVVLPAILLLLTLCAMQPVNAEPIEFEVDTAEGKLNTEALRGEVVYIDFWASWCAPCRKSFPWMNAMHQKYADKGLRIIAINLDKDRALSDQFLGEVPAEFTIGFDPDATLAEQFGLVGMPSAFVLNRQGEIIDKHVGFRQGNIDEYEHSIIQALK